MSASELTEEEQAALKHAVEMRGRFAKTAIRTAWFTGGYRAEMLEEYSGTLQRLRNRPGGRRALDKARIKDYR